MTTKAGPEANRIVQKAVDAAIAEGGEIGLQVAAYLNGELAVDVWGGLADETTGRRVDSAYTVNLVLTVANAISAGHPERDIRAWKCVVAARKCALARSVTGNAFVRTSVVNRSQCASSWISIADDDTGPCRVTWSDVRQCSDLEVFEIAVRIADVQ